VLVNACTYQQGKAHPDEMNAGGDDTTLTATHQQPVVDYMTHDRQDNSNGERTNLFTVLIYLRTVSTTSQRELGEGDLPLPVSNCPPPVNARYMIPTPQLPRQPIYRYVNVGGAQHMYASMRHYYGLQ
jgi:hypothetical protein